MAATATDALNFMVEQKRKLAIDELRGLRDDVELLLQHLESGGLLRQRLSVGAADCDRALIELATLEECRKLAL